MKRTVYEVWAKTYSDELKETVMTLRGSFAKITDAQLFQKAYEKAWMTKAIIVRNEEE